MKWKGISPLEKHVDKAALAVAALFLLYVLYGFLLTNRYTVALNGEQVPAGQVDRRVLSVAERHLGRELDGPAFFEPEEVVNVAASFEQLLLEPSRQSVARLTLPLGGVGGGIAVEPTDSPGDIFTPIYAIPDLPAPEAVAAERFFGTLDTNQSLPEAMRDLLPAQPPLDLQWVSAGGLLNTAPIRASYLNPTGGAQPMDPAWLEEAFRIVDLRIQRRAKQADGSWGEAELVPAMPGPQARFRAALADDPTPEAVRDAADRLWQTGSAGRTPFFALRDRTFEPPIRRPETDAPSDGDESASDDGRGEVRFGDPARDEPAGDSRRGGGSERPEPPAEVRLLSGEPMELFGHDLFIEPETEYQYRLRLAVLNPVFGRAQLNARQPARDQPLLFSDWSAWTDPVRTRRSSYVFVIGGSRGQASARVAVWRFVDGLWLAHETSVLAGDPIGGVVGEVRRIDGEPADRIDRDVDMTTDYTVLDVTFAQHPTGIGGRMEETTRLLLIDGAGNLIQRYEMDDRARRRAIREDLQRHLPEPEAESRQSDNRADETRRGLGPGGENPDGMMGPGMDAPGNRGRRNNRG